MKKLLKFIAATGNRLNDQISLRFRVTTLVTAEMLVSNLIVMGLDSFLPQHIPLHNTLVLAMELTVVSLLVGIIATSQVSKMLFRPIKRLRSAMGEVAKGDFTVRLASRSATKDIQDIYTGFNLMTAELGATEILQTDFVSNVSHEFKTPINAIEGYSMLLQDSDNLSDDQKEYVEKILFNTNRLSALMSSILLLSKLENQQIPTNRKRYRLDEQIRQSVVALEPAWEKKNIQFDAELEALEYLGNEPMMRHVWDNLISNAIKFSTSGCTLRLALFAEADQLVFTIDDCGPGLSEESKKHLFDKFYQADSSHKQEGHGLGLALVKRILTIEDGQIMAENLARGCRFTVILQSRH